MAQARSPSAPCLLRALTQDVRATRLRSGGLDGAILPHNLAATFEGDDTRKTYEATSYDIRTVTPPTDGEATGDLAIRQALAVDRGAMAGTRSWTARAARPSTTFAPDVTRAHDPGKARTILDDAGWKTGADGIRTAMPDASTAAAPVEAVQHRTVTRAGLLAVSGTQDTPARAVRSHGAPGHPDGRRGSAPDAPARGRPATRCFAVPPDDAQESTV